MQKKILLDNFINKWRNQFSLVPEILYYIYSQPEITSAIEEIELIEKEDLFYSQYEWISFVSKLNNPIEAEFFREYWVPINKNGYDYFLDISMEPFSLFSIEYSFIQPYRWRKRVVNNDLWLLKGINKWSELIIPKELMLTKPNRIRNLNKLSPEDEAGIAGKIAMTKYDENELHVKGTARYAKIYSNELEFSSVYPIYISLLNEKMEIILTDFEAPFNLYENLNAKISTVGGLFYLLQLVGGYSNISYSFYFKDLPNSKVNFQNKTFQVFHENKEVLKEICNKTGHLGVYLQNLE